MGLVDQPMMVESHQASTEPWKISRLDPVVGIMWAGKDQGLLRAHVVRIHAQSPAIVQWSMGVDEGALTPSFLIRVCFQPPWLPGDVRVPRPQLHINWNALSFD